jgi:His-Xaa-Ser system protein HxsD
VGIQQRNEPLKRDFDRYQEVTFPVGLRPVSNPSEPVVIGPAGLVALEVDRAIFSLDVVLRAAYKFTDRCYLFVRSHEARQDRWLVVLKAKSSAANAEAYASELANELLDQQLRVQLERQFHDVRTLIVAQAFAEGNLLEPTEGEDDFVADPLSIGRLRG